MLKRMPRRACAGCTKADIAGVFQYLYLNRYDACPERGRGMGRREFFSVIAGAAAWPLAARAQQPPPMGVPLSSPGERQLVIGFLHAVVAAEYGFRRGLSEMGFVDGRNVAIDYRSAAGQYDRLPAMAAELASRNVAVIVSLDGDLATWTAMATTRTIPIVFTTASNPVQLGFVASFNRPGGNVTGITTFGEELLPKRLELLRELLPTASKVALLFNPRNPATLQVKIQSVQVAARRLGLEIVVVFASTENEIDNALAAAVEQRAAAIVVASDAFFSSRREYLALLALRHALPTISDDRIATVAAVAGQLMSYAPNLDELYQLAGTFVGRILRGERPADLPVLQPTKFELAINLKTAKALGITVSPMLLGRADEVID
jgi:putative ABC transport system substrate-binding protein